MKNNNNGGKIMIKIKNSLGDAGTNYISTNDPKNSNSKISNSNNNTNSNNNNNNTNTQQKTVYNDNSNNNNKTYPANSTIQLNLHNIECDDTSSKESHKEEKEEKKNISKSMNSTMTKINIVKRKRKRLLNNQNINNEKKMRGQLTIFQKIITNLDKVKTKADRTIDAMKKNLRKTRIEIVKRRNYQKCAQIVPTNILNFEKFEKKRNTNNLNGSLKYNNSQGTFYISKIKNRNISNIFPNISSYNINQSLSKSNGSTTININNNLNEISESNAANMNNTINVNVINGYKTGTLWRPQLKLIKEKKCIGFTSTLNLYEIPRDSLGSIKNEYPYKPLFQRDKKKNCYKNMYHVRNFDFSLKKIRSHCYKIYNIPAILIEQSSYNKDSELNSLTIINKIELIQDNIDYFKINIMYKNDFLEAFKNMENYQKAEFNYNMEEIGYVLIEIVPIIFQNFYDILQKLLAIVIPNVDEEKKKKPENETECLNLNYTFFNSVSDYFSICLEVYKTLNKKCNRFYYTINEFAPLSSYLDVTRYNTTNLISMANSFIVKTKTDKKILEKLEDALNIKRMKKEEEDMFERYHERHRIKASEEDIKIERINRVLNLRSRINRPEIDEKKYFDKYKVNKKISAFNTAVFRDMMKYFKPSIKAKIIAQKVIDRYEQKKKKFGNLNEDDGE